MIYEHHTINDYFIQ